MPTDILTRKAGTTSLTDQALDAFAAQLRGTLIRPTDAAYEEARRVWNGRIDRKPALIARCQGTADVMHAVDFVRERNLLPSVLRGAYGPNLDRLQKIKAQYDPGNLFPGLLNIPPKR